MRPNRFSEQNTNAGGPRLGNLDKNALVLVGDQLGLIIAALASFRSKR